MSRSAFRICTSVLALTACSPEAASHASYGQECTPVTQYEYRGFCLPDAGQGTHASGVGRDDGAVPPVGTGGAAGNDGGKGDAQAGAGAGVGAAGAAGATDPTPGDAGAMGDAGSDAAAPSSCTADAGQAEICNGLDDDCDDRSDEAIEESCYDGATGCEAAAGAYRCSGLCSAGVRQCVAGVLGDCEGQRTPAAGDACTQTGELAADEDCDGTIDEGCPCTDAPQACYSGSAETRDVAPCHAGTQTCTNTGFGPCEGQMLPSAETCANAGADDDCDGRADDVPMLGSGCTDDALSGRCRTGTRRCSGGDLVCETLAPIAETCDGTDQDCDGRSDEGFDLQVNRDHCGACGRACNGEQTCCAGACVDIVTSSAHCGECGNDCGAGQACCGAACQNLQSDPGHCGACNRVCTAGQSCCGGSCVDTATNLNNCGACGNRCGSGDQCCAGGCHDLESTEAHCGRCGNGCGALHGCCESTCQLLSLGCVL